MVDSSTKPYSLLASQMSKYIRNQRAALEERKQAQKIRESRLVSQVIKQNVTGEAALRAMLEELIKKKPQINLKKALSFIQNTFNLRQQIKFANYKELLKAHSFLLRHPKMLSKEIGMHYPQIGTEGAENNFQVLLTKFAAIHNIECLQDDKGQIERLIKIQVKMQQDRFVKKSKFRPIALTEVDSHQKNVQFDTTSFRPFSLNVLCCGQTISNVLLMGDKEVVYKFEDMSCMTTFNCLELFVLSHKALDIAVAPENAYFFHFLNHVFFNQELPVGVRYPMKKLHDFLNIYKSV